MSEEELAEGERKFNSCKFRSLEMEEIGEFSCCKNTLRPGWVCFRTGTEDIGPADCAKCELFKERINK